MNIKILCQKEAKAFELYSYFVELNNEHDCCEYELERARYLHDYYYSLREYYFNNCQGLKPRFIIGGYHG